MNKWTDTNHLPIIIGFIAKCICPTNWGECKSLPQSQQSNQVMVFAERGKLEYPGKLSKNKTKMDSIHNTNVWLK